MADMTTGKVIALIRALSTSSTSSATYTVTDALIVGTATTSGVRLDLESGMLSVREGDDSAYGVIQGTFKAANAGLYAQGFSQGFVFSSAASGGTKYSAIRNQANGEFALRSTGALAWSSTTAPDDGSYDTGITRDSAGQVKVTDGSTGVGNLRATALIVGTADTNGARLDLETGVLAVREGDDSAYAPLRAYSLAVGIGSATSTAGEIRLATNASQNHMILSSSGTTGSYISMTAGANQGLLFSNSATDVALASLDLHVTRSAAATLGVREYVNGAVTNVHQITASSGALSGASYSFTNALPAGAIILGVTVRVTTTITGATSFDVGDGTDVDRYGAAIALASGTTTTFASATASPLEWRSANGNVVLTANGSNFTGGVVRICVHYLTGTAPTS